MPTPSFFSALTFGAALGSATTDPRDYSPGGLFPELRLGVASGTSGLGGELSVRILPGELREVPYAFVSTGVTAALVYDAFNRPRVDIPLRLGLGLRRMYIDDVTRIDGYAVERQLGLLGTTDDLVIFAGFGARFHLVGVLHLRSDMLIESHIGGLPMYSQVHQFWALTPTLGVDLRAGTPPDRDRDGVLDTVDACRAEPEDRDAFEDLDGCPDLDNDADGAPDVLDECPLAAEDRDGYYDRDGCPEPNNDSDRYPDVDDGCPSEAETDNGWLDGDGCRDVTPAAFAVLAGPRPDVLLANGLPDPALAAALAAGADALRGEPAARLLAIVHPAAWSSGKEPEEAVAIAKVIQRSFAEAGVGDRAAVWWAEAPPPTVRGLSWQGPAREQGWVELVLIDPVDTKGKPVPLRSLFPAAPP